MADTRTSNRGAAQSLLSRIATDDALRTRFIAAYTGTSDPIGELEAAALDDQWWERPEPGDRLRLNQVVFGKDSGADQRAAASNRLKELLAAEEDRLALVEAILANAGESLDIDKDDEVSLIDIQPAATERPQRSGISRTRIAVAALLIFSVGAASGHLLTRGTPRLDDLAEPRARNPAQTILHLSSQADTWLASAPLSDPVRPASPEIASLLPGRYAGYVAGVDFWGTRSTTGEYCVVSQSRSVPTAHHACVTAAEYDPSGVRIVSDAATLNWAGSEVTLSTVERPGGS